jgi:hypothetical protein
MQFVCDAPEGKAWFRLETEAEAVREVELMRHAVDKYFRTEQEKATRSFQPASKAFIEQEIGLKAHLRRAMPLFLTLRDDDGKAHVTAMLPPRGRDTAAFRPILVGVANSDPFLDYDDAIRALARHFGIALERTRCYPYRRD